MPRSPADVLNSVDRYVKRMAGDNGDGAQLKGLSKYFNSHTYNGRANVAKATYAFMGLVILYNVLKPKSK